MKQLILFYFLTITWMASAQLSFTWTQNLEGTFEWQMINAKGDYLVKTTEGLFCYHPETGKLIWSNSSFNKLTQDDVSELPNSSFLMLFENGNKSIVNPFNGEVKFETKSSGLTEVKFQTFLPLSNLIIVAGEKSGEPHFMAVDATTGDTKWSLNEKFGKIVSIDELSRSEIMITTLFNVYRIKSNTGDLVWKNSLEGYDAAIDDNPILGLLKDAAEKMV